MANSQAGRVVAATVIGLLFAFLAVIARYLARCYQRMATYAEDWFVYAALVCKVGIDVGGIVLLRHGLGNHIGTLTANDLVVFAKTQYSGSFLYPACITFIKLSILMQYRRLFFAHSRAFHFQIHALIILVSLWGAGIIFTAFGMCSPMSQLWSPIPEGHCTPIVPFYYGLQIPNIVTDLLIIIVPIREILLLELTPKLKIGASAMFLLGMITLIFDIVRLVAMIDLQNHGMEDMTYNLADAAVWTTIEPTVAIVTVCIPSVRSLYRAQRKSFAYATGSTMPVSSVKETFDPSKTGIKIGELAEMRSQEGLRDNAEEPGEAVEHSGDIAEVGVGGRQHQQWPPVGLLLESERPFARFEEYEGRQRS